MKKQINVKELIPGMHLSKICGSWLEHPFWKSEFILTAQDIKLLQESNITEVWIDLKKGINISKSIHENINNTLVENKNHSQSPISSDCKIQTIQQNNTFPEKTSFKQEIKKAKSIVKNSGAVVQSMFNDIRMGKAFNENDAILLVDEISESVFKNSDALISIARLKNKDNYTYIHSVAVCALMVSLAKTLGYDKEFCKKAGKAGLLHDIGKMFIPLDILNKPGKLTDEEFKIVKEHPIKGWELLKESKAFEDETLDVCLHHHEKFDGSGYPKGLQGEEISVLSRMGAICDIYDAITSDRPYKKGWEPTVSIKNMSQWNGHFDPKIFRAFVSSIGIYPVGSMVRLKSGRVGIVIEKCETNLLTPKVKVFFSSKSNLRIHPEIIDLSKPGTKDKIESAESDFKISQQEISDLLTIND